MNLNQQPASLKFFFGTEMWERYGFYTVQTLLALFLSNHFGWQDTKVYPLVGCFTALTYISPVIGGFIADKLVGQKLSVVLGIVVLFCSYALLSYVHAEVALSVGLAGIAVGTGLLKPNISSLLGNQYAPGSSLRESGFTIFYMGITLGIILGTLVPGQIQPIWGWPAAFISAAVGIVLAFFVFNYAIFFLNIKDYKAEPYNFRSIVLSLLIIACLWVLCFFILHSPKLANSLFCLVVILSAYYILHSSKKACQQQKTYNYIIGLLCIISTVFWSFYFQMFLSFTLFIERTVNPELFGLHMPPPYYVSLQSMGMMVLGYFIAKNRRHRTKSNQTLLIAQKFLLAILVMILAFALILGTCYFSKHGQLISPFYIMPSYLLISLAELLLSPVGLSAITLLASRTQVSTMMGIFFVSLGTGGFLSGKIADLTAVNTAGLSLMEVQQNYSHGFLKVFILLFIAGLLCLFMYFLIKRLITQLKITNPDFE